MAKTILITGASAGLGAALAHEYAGRGWNLVLTARRTDRLKALADELQNQYGVEADHVTIDLMERDSVDQMLAEIENKGHQIDGLINNAGYGHPGLFMDSDWDAHDRFIHLMATVPTETTHKLLPGMIDRGFGRIMNVASLAGHMPGSRGHTLYAAVKAYLIKFSESLHTEMGDNGVHVSALCPGFTITEFHDVNGTREGINKLPAIMKMSAEECAALGADALEMNRDVFISGRFNKFLALIPRLMPSGVSKALMARGSGSYRKTD